MYGHPSVIWMEIVLYPASTNFQTLSNELCFNSGIISISMDLSFNFFFVDNPFYEDVAEFPVGIITILFDAIPVLICSYSSRQKLEVFAESNTADLLLSIVAALFLSLFTIF